jgi:hypothetical protein
MKLVDNAKDAWKWFSRWAMGAPAAAGATWLCLPDDVRATVLERVGTGWLVGSVVTLLMLGMVGRMVDQTKK